MGAIMDSPRVNLARAFAKGLLSDLETRWRHTMGVAARAAELAPTVAEQDQEVLLVAAWLHDVGHSRDAVRTGIHAVDGAAYLDRHGWPRRIVALVAHHSGAMFVAEASG